MSKTVRKPVPLSPDLLVQKAHHGTPEPVPTPADLPPDRVFVSIRMDRLLHRRLRRYAFDTDQEMQEVVAEAVRLLLDSRGAQPF